ncbi:hypothetical protein [Streptosporangium sp. NPDC051022]|uniref:hypothetical protein n=1 Tax=Streptosporangium sp. NPDC051022 TaxID=3155752 RepID=UPI00343773EC
MISAAPTASAVTCPYLGERHTDAIEYRHTPLEVMSTTWGTYHDGPGPDLTTYVFKHCLHCLRHDTPLYVSIAEAQAGIRLGGVPLVEHEGYRRALARLEEELADLSLIVCSQGSDSIRYNEDRRILVDGQVVPRGEYRLEYGDGKHRKIIVR